MMTTRTEIRYLIRPPVPRAFRLSDFGVARDETGLDAELKTEIEAELTDAEFHAIFGAEASMAESMIHPVNIADGWDVVVKPELVVSNGAVTTVHDRVIRALRESNPSLGTRPLEASEMSPAAMQFLLSVQAATMERHGVDPVAEAERAREKGLRLEDFCSA